LPIRNVGHDAQLRSGLSHTPSAVKMTKPESDAGDLTGPGNCTCVIGRRSENFNVFCLLDAKVHATTITRGNRTLLRGARQAFSKPGMDLQLVRMPAAP
jgi:hypothetical protein